MPSSRLRVLPAVVALALGAAVTLSAPAAYAHPGEGSVRLGAGLAPLQLTHYPEPDVTQVFFGLGPQTLGLHFGYQVTPEIGIGARLVFGGIHFDSPLGSNTLLSFSALPRFEYMITPHGVVAIYFGAEAGFQVFGDPGAPNLSEFFLAGGLFGLRIFAETSFSIDLEAQPGFIYDIDSDNAGFMALVYLSFTGWLDTGG